MTEAVKQVLEELEADLAAIDEEIRQHREVVAERHKRISALREQREEATRTWDYLAKKSGRPVKVKEEAPESTADEGLYAGKSIPEAAERYLASVGQPPRPTREIADKTVEGGLTSEAKNIYATFFGSLRRAAKRDDSRLVKVGTEWGLRDWYPDGVPEVKVELESAKGGEDAEAVAS